MTTEKHTTDKTYSPILIVMLTYNDETVKNAYEIFDKCKNCKAVYWGFKEEPLPLPEMKELYAYMKKCGKKTVLEVVAYTQEKSLEGTKMAVECGCDILMGTMYSDEVNEICQKNNIKYMPFVGKIHGRPSVLEGTCEEMVQEAMRCVSKGAYGIDLLGYRYNKEPVRLNAEFTANVEAPVCLAGSINSWQRLQEVKQARPWAFTIGSAFFDNQFGQDFGEQIDLVCEYMEK